MPLLEDLANHSGVGFNIRSCSPKKVNLLVGELQREASSFSVRPSLKDFFPTHLVYNDGVLSPFLLSAGVLSLSESTSKNLLFEYSYFNVASAPPLGVKHPIFLVILISSSIVVTRVTRPSAFRLYVPLFSRLSRKSNVDCYS